MSDILHFQESLRPVLPVVLGCKDYLEQEQLLKRIHSILQHSGIEHLFISLHLQNHQNGAPSAAATPGSPNPKTRGGATEKQLLQSVQALRCTILGKLLGSSSYRDLSCRLAECQLFRWFCRLEEFEKVRVPGKSTLHEYAHWLPMAQMEQILSALTQAVGDENRARLIGLKTELALDTAWVDTTCVKALIHFPTDWVLLRDGVRTLVKAILCIRRHGLQKRIQEPERFLSQVNALSMGMTASARKSGAKKARKRQFRAMKKLTQVVEAHGRRYREELDQNWEQTDLSRAEAEVILERLDNVLEKLPEARRQAHERIIGGRPVANSDKMLSLYEEDVHVIVRGKAGATVEFGNSLFIAETLEGYIMDHALYQKASGGDVQVLLERLAHMEAASQGKLAGVIADRGFDSKASRSKLSGGHKFNGLCPKNPEVLKQRMEEEEEFCKAMKRRGQTEGRIGILKNVFLEGRPRAKGFKNRQLEVAWAVLAHNLWVLARLPWAEESEKQLAA